MNNKVTKERYFCEAKLNNESEVKLHLEIAHTPKEAKFKCEDFEFHGENELSVEVHHSDNF